MKELLAPLRHVLFCISTLMLVSLASSSYAQHIMDPNASSSDVEMESSPANDEILAQSPRDLMLRFSTYVQLVKLTVKDPSGKAIDVGFRYDINASRVFFWDLPTLPDADYYTVEWAAIDPAKLIARGSFSFSFGPDARPASELIPEEEVLLHIPTPDFRLQDQPL
ncbi:MAG: copper resistance protein CopC [Pseudohongiellaceae bacterium]|nr:copper resistance protein CopC [Pseudohongiellaceae bacterium]